MNEATRIEEESRAVGEAGRPAEPDAQGQSVSEKKRKVFEIDIFRGWCKSCGICSAFCPRDCIGLDENGSPQVTDYGRCTGCGWCELHCPDFAISVHPKKLKTAREGEEE